MQPARAVHGPVHIRADGQRRALAPVTCRRAPVQVRFTAIHVAVDDVGRAVAVDLEVVGVVADMEWQPRLHTPLPFGRARQQRCPGLIQADAGVGQNGQPVVGANGRAPAAKVYLQPVVEVLGRAPGLAGGLDDQVRFTGTVLLPAESVESAAAVAAQESRRGQRRRAIQRCGRLPCAVGGAIAIDQPPVAVVRALPQGVEAAGRVDGDKHRAGVVTGVERLRRRPRAIGSAHTVGGAHRAIRPKEPAVPHDVDIAQAVGHGVTDR